MYVCICDPKIKSVNGTVAVDSPFQTLAVSRQIYRLALPLRAPETLSSLSKSRISSFNAHLALFIQRMTQLRSHTTIGKYRHLAN